MGHSYCSWSIRISGTDATSYYAKSIEKEGRKIHQMELSAIVSPMPHKSACSHTQHARRSPRISCPSLPPRTSPYMETIERAARLKRLIDNVPRCLNPVGTCLTFEKDFRNYHSDFPRSDSEYHSDSNSEKSDQDPESHNEHYYGTHPRYPRMTEDERAEQQTIKDLQRAIVNLYSRPEHCMDRAGDFENYEITVNGESFDRMGDIKADDVERWYNLASNSGFGNVREQITQRDQNVRSSKEFTTEQFSVDEKFLDLITKIWYQKMGGRHVTAKPYKVIIYAPGDHFSWHKDTPEEKLCGTFLLSVFHSCSTTSGFELLESDDTCVKWDEFRHNYCGFYPDIPHRVDKTEFGYRVVLSFKIFDHDSYKGKPPKLMYHRDLFDEIAQCVKKIHSVGILLKHQYGYGAQDIYGCDLMLVQQLKAHALEVELNPVLIHFKGTAGDDVDYYADEDPEADAKVFYLHPCDLDRVSNILLGEAGEGYSENSEIQMLGSKSSKTTEHNDKLRFLDCLRDNKRGLWSSTIEDAAEKLGNYCRPFREDSVYVRYAAIVRS